MKAKSILGKLLLSFVLVSIGFAIGTETAGGKKGSRVDLTAATAPGGDKVIVYYMHASFRCATCNLVESMGAELVRTEFGDALKAGRVEWKTVNYQDDEQIAGKYNVGGNMIIVAKIRDGKEIESRRLDRVMELAGNRDQFMTYVRGAIHELLRDDA